MVCLDVVYQEEIAKCAEILRNETVCLSFDGWSNVHNVPIICACINTLKGDVYLVDTIDTSGNPHTGEYLSNIILKTINKIETKFSCIVGSIVSDGAANMNLMRKMINNSSKSSEEQNDITEKHGNKELSSTHEASENIDIDKILITYHCSAHLCNLLACDFEIPNVSCHIIRVVKYFRNNHFARAKFQELKSKDNKNLSMPQEVRWNTMHDCLQNYLDNWATIADICDKFSDEIDNDIKKIVMNMAIKQNASDLVNLLKPIAIALDKTQAATCKIADAVFIWKNLKISLRSSGLLTAKRSKIFNNRYAEALTPAHFLAFLATPKYYHAQEEGQIIELTSAEKNSALQYLEEKFGNAGKNFLPTLLKFNIGAEPFQGSLMKEEVIKKLSAAEWWSSFKEFQGTVKMEDFKILYKLFSASATSADVERIFSTFNLVHSKIRNALGTEKAGKLVFLFRVLNLKN